MKIKSGVIRNPPPMPNIPEMKSDRQPHGQNKENVHGQIGDRKIDLHALFHRLRE